MNVMETVTGTGVRFCTLKRAWTGFVSSLVVLVPCILHDFLLYICPDIIHTPSFILWHSNVFIFTPFLFLLAIYRLSHSCYPCLFPCFSFHKRVDSFRYVVDIRWYLPSYKGLSSRRFDWLVAAMWILRLRLTMIIRWCAWFTTI